MKARVTFFLPVFLALLLAGVGITARGQCALDGFDPNPNAFSIYAIVVQPDGRILVGGYFTTVLGVPRNNIARLNPDGTLDTIFNPNANDGVRLIAFQTDGKILVGGAFNATNSIGGQSRNYLARLDPVTGAADSFTPARTVQSAVVWCSQTGRL